MRIDSHARYKRNQVEEALAYCLHFQPPIQPDLRLQIKRLLDKDRAIGINPRANPPELRRLAFASHKPQGSGYDVEYTAYDAFAIYLGIKLLRAGFAQLKVVMLMRSLRSELLIKHHNILCWDPVSLGHEEPNENLDSRIGDGQLVRTLDNMACLILPTDKYGGLTYKTKVDQAEERPANIAKGTAEINARLQSELDWGATPIVIELVNPAHQLAYWLDRSDPRSRGRGR